MVKLLPFARKGKVPLARLIEEPRKNQMWKKD
jgi:hypothetical protein